MDFNSKILQNIGFKALLLTLSGVLGFLLINSNNGSFSDEFNVSEADSVYASLKSNQYQFVGLNNRKPVITPMHAAAFRVALINFELKAENGEVQIKWSTTSEKDNDFFTIQRSQDGIHFSDVAKINGAGNSSMVMDYSAYDNSPYPGTSYYRLKQTSYEGRNSFLGVRTIEIREEDKRESFIITPNPIPNDHRFKILSASNQIENVIVSVYDIERNCVIKFPPTELGKHTLEMEITLPKNLLPGTYIAEINSPTQGISQQRVWIN